MESLLNLKRIFFFSLSATKPLRKLMTNFVDRKNYLFDKITPCNPLAYHVLSSTFSNNRIRGRNDSLNVTILQTLFRWPYFKKSLYWLIQASLMPKTLEFKINLKYMFWMFQLKTTTFPSTGPATSLQFCWGARLPFLPPPHLLLSRHQWADFKKRLQGRVFYQIFLQL